MIALLKRTADACDMLIESFVVTSIVCDNCKKMFLKVILDENIIH